jgi:anti-anti-sigma regulatory factor
VAFSLFGKKDDPPSKKSEVKKTQTAPPAQSKSAQPAGAAAQPAARAAPPSAPPVDEDDDLSLDFTSFVPLPMGVVEEPAPASLAKPAATAPAAPVTPKPAVPAAASPKPAAPAVPAAVKPVAPPPPVPAPAVAQPTASPAAKPAAAASQQLAPAVVKPAAAQQAKRKPAPPDSIMSIEVTAATDGLAAVIEEAAVLFANAQDKAALKTLVTAVHEGDLSKPARQIWLMLFDLYEHLGMKKEHDELALDFAAKFERSPPTWVEQQRAVAGAGVELAAEGGSSTMFTGALDAGIGSRLDQARHAAGDSQSLRFDFSGLASVDAAACRLLHESLLQMRRAGNTVLLSGEAQLIALLAAEARAGDRSIDQAFWLLLLDIYQMGGQHDAYEEVALNFAITYELSPPAWEPARVATVRAAEAAVTAAAAQSEQVLRLSGDITGADERTLKAIVEHAAESSLVLIDFSAVPRVDFVSAGQLLNTFSKLHQSGKVVKIRGANELIVALFAVMGVQAVTGIEQKR